MSEGSPAPGNVTLVPRPEAPATRTRAIAAAVDRELARRRAMFDADGALAVVQITVRLHAGTTVVKGIQVTEERVLQRAAPR